MAQWLFQIQCTVRTHHKDHWRQKRKLSQATGKTINWTCETSRFFNQMKQYHRLTVLRITCLDEPYFLKAVFLEGGLYREVLPSSKETNAEIPQIPEGDATMLETSTAQVITNYIWRKWKTFKRPWKNIIHNSLKLVSKPKLEGGGAAAKFGLV